jgi:hypothetical protein
MRDFFAEEADAALIGAEKAVGELEENAFADAGRTQQDTGLARSHGKTDVLKHGRSGKGQRDVAKGHNGARLLCWRRDWSGLGEDGVHIHPANRESKTWVMRKSTKMMSTDAVTTA